EDDKAALAVVSALVFLIYAIIGITLKLIIRLNITSLKTHEVLLLISVALLFLQTTFVITACNHGLGRHQNVIQPAELKAFYKLFYASSIFATATAATTKLSLCLLIQSINNHGKFNIANHLLFGVVIAWMMSGITAEGLHVPILSIPGLISTHTLVTDYTDSTWHAVPHVIWLQCTLGLSVMTACIPSLKGVIDSLMGSTSVATIQAPYQLTSSGGDESGRLHATAIVGGTNSRYGSHLTSGAANSRATRSKSLRPSDWPVAVQGHVHESRKDKEEGAYRTESNEDLVPQRHESRSSSREGSYKSSEAGYRL
ncbi:integral membrane protein, partial [Colletotrichum asianum]